MTDSNDADFVVVKIGVCDDRLRIPVVVGGMYIYRSCTGWTIDTIGRFMYDAFRFRCFVLPRKF